MPPPPPPGVGNVLGTPASSRAESIPPVMQHQQAQQQMVPSAQQQRMPAQVHGTLPHNAQQQLAMIHQANVARMGQQQQPLGAIPGGALGGGVPIGPAAAQQQQPPPQRPQLPLPTPQQVLQQLTPQQRDQLMAMPEMQQRQQMMGLQMRMGQNMLNQQQAQQAQATAVAAAANAGAAGAGAVGSVMPGMNGVVMAPAQAMGMSMMPGAMPVPMPGVVALPPGAMGRPIVPLPQHHSLPAQPQQPRSNIPPHLAGHVDQRMTSISVLPFVKDVDDVTHGGALPELSEAEINQVAEWIAKDKEYIKIVAENQTRRERFQKEGVESVGKPMWWELDELERRNGGGMGNGAVPGTKLAVLWPEEKKKFRKRKIGRVEMRL